MLNVPETSLAPAPHSDPGDFRSLPLESLRAQGVPSGEAVSPQAGTTSSSTGVADSSPASLALPGVHLGVLWLVVMEKSSLVLGGLELCHAVSPRAEVPSLTAAVALPVLVLHLQS